MRSVSPRGPMPCPPYASLAASTPDEALRPTASRRPLYLVEVSEGHPGFHPTDLYVRRFWTAHLGVEAVTELLRVVQAGRRGNAVRKPLSLSLLLAAGLVHVEGNVIVVVDRIPELDQTAVSQLPVALREAHRHWQQRRSNSANGSPGSNGQRRDLAGHKTRRNSKVRSAR